jgi:hypothetical protein
MASPRRSTSRSPTSTRSSDRSASRCWDRPVLRTGARWTHRPVPRGAADVGVSITLPEDFPAGRRRVGLAVTQHDEPGISATTSLDLVLPPQPGLTQTIEPTTLTVGRSGTFVLTPANTGNTTLELRFLGQEPERKVDVRFDPPTARLLPGEQAQVRPPPPVPGPGSAHRSCGSWSSSPRRGTCRSRPPRSSCRSRASVAARWHCSGCCSS